MSFNIDQSEAAIIHQSEKAPMGSFMYGTVTKYGVAQTDRVVDHSTHQTTILIQL